VFTLARSLAVTVAGAIRLGVYLPIYLSNAMLEQRTEERWDEQAMPPSPRLAWFPTPTRQASRPPTSSLLACLQQR
jgi:hypothetical protein